MRFMSFCRNLTRVPNAWLICEKILVGDRVQVAGQTKAATVVSIESSRKRFTVSSGW